MPGSRVHEKKDPYRSESDDQDDRPYHLFQSKFPPFARGGMMTEHDEKDTWGHKLPEHQMKWLNSSGDFREIPTAYPTVSSHTVMFHVWVFRRFKLTFL
jgi:hypothetical protein